MSKTGPILLIEDDIDDKELFAMAIKDLGVPNEVIWFRSGEKGYDYLSSTDKSVFVIFCDINMPLLNGLDFKKSIDDDPVLRQKSIPFVFYSTSANQRDVNEAYTHLAVQGFFKKKTEFKAMKEEIRLILDYWRNCIHPNTQ
ncbi:MAG: response regulator [Flavobacterium sp.]|nr:MAG: response regulator [Flavobacterium sp.]